MAGKVGTIYLLTSPLRENAWRCLGWEREDREEARTAACYRGPPAQQHSPKVTSQSGDGRTPQKKDETETVNS